MQKVELQFYSIWSNSIMLIKNFYHFQPYILHSINGS